MFTRTPFPPEPVLKHNVSSGPPLSTQSDDENMEKTRIGALHQSALSKSSEEWEAAYFRRKPPCWGESRQGCLQSWA